jgi:DNA-binding transcriptional LysR family regulator
MQNRRIINRNFHDIGATPAARIESNSTVVLAATVSSGDWVTILPGDMATFLAEGRDLTAIPIGEAQTSHVVGLVTEYQEPHTPVLSALMETAKSLAA